MKQSKSRSLKRGRLFCSQNAGPKLLSPVSPVSMQIVCQIFTHTLKYCIIKTNEKDVWRGKNVTIINV